MLKRLARRLGVRCGQTTAEYAIIVALVAICSIGVILIFGNQIRELFFAESSKLTKADQAVPVTDVTSGKQNTTQGSLKDF